MPKNTQMHMQWITVNGQSVPLVLPQYWDGEKWVISSEQNPLPVKAQLTGRKVELIINQTNQTSPLGAGLSEAIDIKPPSGYVYKLIDIQFSASGNAQATSGTHRVIIRPSSHLNGAPRFLEAIADYNNEIAYRSGVFLGVLQTEIPRKEAQPFVFKGMIIDSKGLQFLYENHTNSETTSLRRITIYAEKIKVG